MGLLLQGYGKKAWELRVVVTDLQSERVMPVTGHTLLGDLLNQIADELGLCVLGFAILGILSSPVLFRSPAGRHWPKKEGWQAKSHVTFSELGFRSFNPRFLAWEIS